MGQQPVDSSISIGNQRYSTFRSCYLSWKAMIRQPKSTVDKVLQTVLLPIETKRYVGATV